MKRILSLTISFVFASVGSLHCMDNQKPQKLDSNTFLFKDYQLTHVCEKTRSLIHAHAQNQWAGTVIWQGASVRALEVAPEESSKGLGAELFCNALQQIKEQGFDQAHWYAYRSTNYYLRFGARIEQVSSIDPSSAYMYFDFKRDGDPRDHLKQYLIKKQRVQPSDKTL